MILALKLSKYHFCSSNLASFVKVTLLSILMSHMSNLYFIILVNNTFSFSTLKTDNFGPPTNTN